MSRATVTGDVARGLNENEFGAYSVPTGQVVGKVWCFLEAVLAMAEYMSVPVTSACIHFFLVSKQSRWVTKPSAKEHIYQDQTGPLEQRGHP